MLNKIKKIVKECLAENDKARNSDWILYRDVCKKMNINVSEISIEQMCENSKAFPSWESVSRARRKLQEQGFYLATDSVRKGRKEQEINYRKEFA